MPGASGSWLTGSVGASVGVVVVMREHGGRTLPFVFKKESDALPTIRRRVTIGAVMHADKSSAWDALDTHYDMKRVKRS